MNTSLDCLPCLFRQALDAVRRISDDPVLCERMMRQVAEWIATADLALSPPVMAQRIHRFLREELKIEDPYSAAKARDNALALSLMPELRNRMADSSDPLVLAIRLAIAGNLIDLGPKHDLSVEDILHSIRQVMDTPFTGDVAYFKQEVSTAKDILYLADNAGEIVLDRLLVEALGPSRVTVAVRGSPVINDATLEDARVAGLCELVPVISNGSDAPGTVLESCNRAFQERFAAADIVISKGQGNFETLNTVSRSIFFLFKVKCPVIASRIGHPQGTQVLFSSRATHERKGHV